MAGSTVPRRKRMKCQNCNAEVDPEKKKVLYFPCPKCEKDTPNINHPRWASQLRIPTAEQKAEAVRIVEEVF